MKYTSDTANKKIKNLQAEEAAILTGERRDRTYAYATNEQPHIPTWYDFAKTQEKLSDLRQQIATLRHAVNRFNITHELPGYGICVDEALHRMSVMNADKKRLFEMLSIPEQERTRAYGSREADIVCRNFDINEAQKAYDQICDDLIQIQQAINIANMTIEFEV